MAHGYLPQDKPAYSKPEFTLTSPIDVQMPSARPLSWHCFGDQMSYTSTSSPPSSGSPLSQDTTPSLTYPFQGESHTTQNPNDEFELLDPGRHRESLSSSSGSSTSDPASPFGPYLCVTPTHIVNIPPDAEVDDAPWNLVAYHIPWGSAYEGYNAGTLPGPDGTCVFLRSPTPTKRQRTSQACEKCRERKAKCSGTRPSCARCMARGHRCFYSSSPPLEPPLCPSRSRSPFLRASRSPSRCRIDRPKLGVSRFLRRKRKNIVPRSEGNIGGGVVNVMRNPSPEDELGSLPLGTREGFSKGQAPQLRRFSIPENPEALEDCLRIPTNTSAPASFSPRSFDSGLPSQVLSGLCRSRVTGARMPSSLYVDSPSRLDEYRFPPLPQSVKSVPIAHPQPQSLYNTSHTPICFPSENPPLLAYDTSWDCPAWSGNSGPADDARKRAVPVPDGGMEFTESLADMPTHSQLFLPYETPDPLHGYRREGNEVSSTTLFSQATFGLFNFPADRVSGVPVMSSMAFQS